jgi:hypothetical protein
MHPNEIHEDDKGLAISKAWQDCYLWNPHETNEDK